MSTYYKELGSDVEPGALQSQETRKPCWTRQDPRSSPLIPDLRTWPDQCLHCLLLKTQHFSGEEGKSCYQQIYITMPLSTSQHQRQDHIYQKKSRLMSPDCLCHSATKWTSPTASYILSRDHRRNQICFKAQGPHSPVHPSFTHTEIKASSPAPRLWALNTTPS